jgi:glycosyltransferase involved in cell wall biosynthesis
MTHSVSLSVLIPTYNRTVLLQALLQSITEATLPTEVEEILVIENGSSVAEPIVLPFKGRIPIKFIQVAEGNKSKALNHIISSLPADRFLLFFDDDITVEPDIFESYLVSIQKYGNGHYFGGEVMPRYESDPSVYLLQYLPLSSTGLYFEGTETRLITKGIFLGTNWGVFVNDLRSVGAFNTKIGPGVTSGARGQETDMQSRLKGNNLKGVAIKHALVHHYVPKKSLTEEWVLNRTEKSSIRHGEQLRGVIAPLRCLAYYCLFSFTALRGGFAQRNKLRVYKGLLVGYFNNIRWLLKSAKANGNI